MSEPEKPATVAAQMVGMTFEQALAHWEVIAKRARLLRSKADGIENEAMLKADAKNAEARKAQAELAAGAEDLDAHYAEIEANCAFAFLRQIQWRESAANTQQRQVARDTRPGAGMSMADVGEIDWSDPDPFGSDGP